MSDDNDHEVMFREEEQEREESAPPTPITTLDMNVIIRGWEEKFAKLTECLREVQLASERASNDMYVVNQDSRAQGQEQERRLNTMQDNLAEFLQKFENILSPATPHRDALRASTPHGAQPRMCPDFEFQTSPVDRELNTLPHTRSARTEDQATSMEAHMGSAHSTLPHIGSARTEDNCRETPSTLPHIGSARTEDNFRETPSTMPHTSSARTEEQSIFRDTHIRDQDDALGDTHTRDQDTRFRDHSDDRNARSRGLHFRLDDQPTHEDDRRNLSPWQCLIVFAPVIKPKSSDI